MTAPRVREYPNEHAPGPVRRQKGNLLRQHWLTGAFVFGLLGITTFTGVHFYQTELRLADIRDERAQWDQKVEDARRQNDTLKQEINRVTSDPYMELKAKTMGYVYKNESVYQSTAGKTK